MSIAMNTAKLLCITGLLLCANAFGACDFDTDDADSPDFMNRISGKRLQYLHIPS